MRRVLGVVSLVAIALSVGESVAAAACAPVAVPGAPMDEVISDLVVAHESAHESAEHPTDCNDCGGEGQECPLAPLMGPGCSPVMSLPGQVISDSWMPSVSDALLFARPEALEPPPPDVLFHPPRV